MSKVVWLLVVALIVLHQDNWNWDDTRLMFGFVPVALMYHIGISLGAGFTWLLATRFCWPLDNSESGAPAAAGQGDRQ